MCHLVFEGVVGGSALNCTFWVVAFWGSIVHINATCCLDFCHMQTSSRSIYRFFFNVIFLLLCLTRTLFVCLYCYYKNITTNYWGWVVLALVSVCTPHCRTSICAAFHSHIFVHYRIWFITVFLCTSVLCGVFLLPQCLCIVYLCCSAYQNHLSFFTFRILQCCLLHDQCFPQLVSFPAFFQGEWKYC